MNINPVFEKDAEGKVKENYQAIIHALSTKSLPLFFTYIGAFPEYFEYISRQIIDNVKTDEFSSLITELSEYFEREIRSNLKHTSSVEDFIQRYKNTPSLYYFRQDLNHIFSTNIKLAIIFIAIREAIKGWAVAAKKLEPSFTESSKTTDSIHEEDFIYKEIAYEFSLTSGRTDDPNKGNQDTDQTGIVKAAPAAIEKDLLPEYLKLCRLEFSQLIKKGEFWAVRIDFEQKILTSIEQLPRFIYSPVSVLYNLTSKHKEFPDLAYLLSESFPTFAMQRMLFSGFMIM